MKKFKYVSNISKEELERNVVIPCIDENGNHSIFIKNIVKKSTTTKYSTDNLIVQMDAVLFLNEVDYYFHILTSLKNDLYSISQFQIIYEYIFNKIDEPLSSKDLSTLIISIEDYFKTTPEKDLISLHVGVFGELFAIRYLYESGYQEIIDKYHNNFYSKHDIEFDSKNRMEIKSTISEKRIHKFKHSQIYRKDANVYVCSILLEQSKEGTSLYDMFQWALSVYTDPDVILELKKLMKRCNVGEENFGLRFSLEKAYSDIKIYKADDLPRLEIEVPNGVSNIIYDIDCSLSKSLLVNDFINKIKEL